MSVIMRITTVLFLLWSLPFISLAAQAEPAPLIARDGWVVKPTKLSFEMLSQRLEQAIGANQMNMVNQASASDGAKSQGFTIAGNRVVGVFRNDYARRMLAASLPAGIEAPIRFYLTENPDRTATLSYRTPSIVFAPYLTQAHDDLKSVAIELDAVFSKIATQATE